MIELNTVEMLRSTADYIEALEEDATDAGAIKRLINENRGLRAEDKRIRPLWGEEIDRNLDLLLALKTIAANTCCDSCQEAKLVAEKALNERL